MNSSCAFCGQENFVGLEGPGHLASKKNLHFHEWVTGYILYKN